jgi:hypothetical protein
MDSGNSVYFVTDRQTTGAGVPAVICGLYERSARIAIEREEGTKTFDVPLWDLLPGRAYTAAILRVCYSAWETLDWQGRSPGSLREVDLVRELVGAGLEQRTAEMCACLLLECGLERQESPLRLAESGPVVLSPSVIKYEMD